MNKKIIRFTLAALVAMFVSSTVLMPTIATVFAAEQASDQEQPQPPAEDAPKDGDHGHSGHDMKNM